MASYVQNILIADGDHIPAVYQFVRHGGNVFDFNAILPLPVGCVMLEEKIKYWGTKGNAINAVFHEEDGSFLFQTLNAAPVPVVERLVERFPDCTFTFRWADEGGGNAGKSCMSTAMNPTLFTQKTVRQGRKKSISSVGASRCIIWKERIHHAKISQEIY